jgi:hypothetical protein
MSGVESEYAGVYSKLGNTPTGESIYWRDQKIEVAYQIIKRRNFDWVKKKAEDNFYRLNRNKINDAIYNYRLDLKEIKENITRVAEEVTELTKTILNCAKKEHRKGGLDNVTAFFAGDDFDEKYEQYQKLMFQKKVLMGQRDEIAEQIEEMLDLALTTSNKETRANAKNEFEIPRKHRKTLMELFNIREGEEEKDPLMGENEEGNDKNTVDEYHMNLARIKELRADRLAAKKLQEAERKGKTKISGDKQEFIEQMSKMFAASLKNDESSKINNMSKKNSEYDGSDDESEELITLGDYNNNNNIKT